MVEPAGATNGAIGSGVTAFQTKVVTVPAMVTTAGARGGIIPIQIGALSSLGGAGVINRKRDPRRPSPRRCRQNKILGGVSCFTLISDPAGA
jgi:hypothetical protein